MSDWVSDPTFEKDDDEWVSDPDFTPPEKPSMLDSLGRGLAQGATLGFADELAGAGSAIYDDIASVFSGKPLAGPKPVRDEFGRVANADELGSWEPYEKYRDESRANFRAAQEANPASYGAGEIGGAVATSLIPGAGAAGSLARATGTGAAIGGLAGLGTSESDLVDGDYKGALVDAGKGAALGGGLSGGAYALGKGVEMALNSDFAKSATEKIGDRLRKFAEKAAVNSTGATGKQATEFADDAGAQLLDRGIVRFGDSQANIAARAKQAVEAANQQIDDSLSKLEASGVKVDANTVYEEIRKKITELKGDPSQADIARMLENELDNLINATDARGSSLFGVKQAEQIKRGYNRKAGNWADPEKGMVGKEMYQTYRGAVENAAESADPATAALFREGKESYGLLRPIEEAAERRAATTAQSPVGGLMDIATYTAGEAATNGGGLVLPIARRVVSPRVSSSVAVGANNISQLMKQYPQALGKFTKVLQDAEARGPQGLAATHFILQSTNPEYRQILQNVADNEGGAQR